MTACDSHCSQTVMTMDTEEPGGEDSSSFSTRCQTGIDGNDVSTESSFHQYPTSRPFLNSDYHRSPVKPVTSFPESNRDGVLSALRSLQEKMQKLEVERRKAESNLQSLTSDTQNHKFSQNYESQMHRRPDMNGSVPSSLGGTLPFTPQPQARELESQLSSAETRCQLLEKQLEHMRHMVQNAEHDRTEAMQKEILQRQRTLNQISPDYQAQLDRIGELERDHLRLTATQTLAEAKIKVLEEKLREEKEHRRCLHERAIELESTAMSHQILLQSTAPSSAKSDSSAKPKKSGSSKKKKKIVGAKKKCPAKYEPTRHYRVNLAEIPFVAGKATTPSHAVGANVQKVLSMMKSHNMALCSSLYNGHRACNGEAGATSTRCHSPSQSSSTSSIGFEQDLADLLFQLQDEFGELSCEHQEYMKQIHEAKDPRIREDLERELDILVAKMEAKGQQISKVRKHQQKLEDAKRYTRMASKKSGPAEAPARPRSAMGCLLSSNRHADSCSHGNARPRTANKPDKHKTDYEPPTLNVLKDMKKLQKTLRRDDLFWD